MNNITGLYFSPTGGTKKIIDEMFSEYENYKSIDVTMVESRQSDYVFSNDDLVVVGLPTYAGRIPAFLMDYLKSIKGNNTKIVYVCTYGNRHYDDILLEMKDLFEENGFVSIGAGAFIARHSYTNKCGTDRPNEDDLNIARQFGSDVLIKWKSGQTNVLIPGNRPYRPFKPTTEYYGPETTKNCHECGDCFYVCPVNAIDQFDYKSVDARLCIHCNACVNVCRVGAKEFTHPTYLAIKDKLETHFTHPRQPELFL